MANNPETIHPQVTPSTTASHQAAHLLPITASPTTSSTIELESEELPYANLEEQRYLERQANLFEQQKINLLDCYQGLYVLFENGQVLDSDCDEAALIQRAYQTGGTRPLFVKQVLLEEPELVLWTPIKD